MRRVETVLRSVIRIAIKITKSPLRRNGIMYIHDDSRQKHLEKIARAVIWIASFHHNSIYYFSLIRKQLQLWLDKTFKVENNISLCFRASCNRRTSCDVVLKGTPRFTTYNIWPHKWCLRSEVSWVSLISFSFKPFEDFVISVLWQSSGCYSINNWVKCNKKIIYT